MWWPDEDYEEVVERLTGALRSWGSWDRRWEPPTRGAVTQARQRLGPEPVAELFSQVAEPVAGLDTQGAFLGPWRLMSVDGTELEAPDTEANRTAFGAGSRDGPYPKVRLVTVCECGSRAPVLAAMGPSVSKGSGEQSLARTLYPRLGEGWLLLADRLFYGWADWCAAADSGADLLWRVKDGVGLPFLELLPDGSYRSVLVQTSVKAARRGEDPGPALARHVRVIEYEVADRGGEDAPITLVTTITGWQAAPASFLAAAYHERWQHETANAQVKTVLRGPGRILRSGSPPVVEQEEQQQHCRIEPTFRSRRLRCGPGFRAGLSLGRLARRAPGPTRAGVAKSVASSARSAVRYASSELRSARSRPAHQRHPDGPSPPGLPLRTLVSGSCAPVLSPRRTMCADPSSDPPGVHLRTRSWRARP